ncbi:splicing regulator SDE2 [Discoglossus pictus]
MAAVWVRDAVTGRVLMVELPQGALVRDLLVAQEEQIPCVDIYVKCNGRIISLEAELQDGLTYSLEPRLCGGKGGFGSMLRALGAQIEKTTNREACRDLSGRRLRDVNHEKAMAEWIKKQAEREAEKEQRRLERLQRKLAEPKHYFTDPEYHQQCSDMSERLEDSVIKGLQASSSTVVSPEASDSRKRTKESESSKEKSVKKKCFWTGVEGLEVSSGSDEGSDSDSDSPCSSSSSMSRASNEMTGPRSHSHESPSDTDEPQQHEPSGVTSEENPELQGDVRLPLKTADIEQQISDTETKNENVSEVSENKDSETHNSTLDSAVTKNDGIADNASENTEAAKQSFKPDCQQDTQNKESSPVDLLVFNSAAEMEALGLEKLKLELMALGLKCGGTLQERASRLYSVRGLSRDQIDPTLFAKPAKGKKK